MSPPVSRAGFVAIVGRPNVGKSTLTNLIAGEKVSIVSDVPQTTRNRIRGIRTMPGGQIVVVDTPGIHKPRHTMNRWMVAEATAAIRDVDLILFMIEVEPGGRPRGPDLGPGDKFVLTLLEQEKTPTFLIVNKVDRVRKHALLPLIDRLKDRFPFREIFPISALTGENAAGLAERCLAYLPEGPPLFSDEHATDRPERFMASEIIREKILHHTRQEIPHETCVLIDTFVQKEGDLTRIEASILVEKESQKGIVIGKDGGLLKIIGTEAREELEGMLGAKVFLTMWVKVREGWRDDETILQRLEIRSTS
ncbi:MAG TPA: GTPase Era [Candidatus Polarisedimenticolia bacterium]|nr:GTPase Era [Candidatus Polarisedimenticolia bacterium]